VIAVVGAGPAGLAAAWRAASAGQRVVVIERAPTVGGMAGSFTVAGLRVDHGSHRLHPSTPAPILAALRGLLGNALQVRTRNGRIRLLDRWVAFPLRTGDLVRHTPASFAARAAADALTGPWRRPQRDTFAEVIRAGLGPAVLHAFYAPYARKLWDTSPDELAGELARRRVSASSPTAIVRRLARGARPEGRTFLYPRGGFGAIPETLADAARAAGADLRLACGLDSLCREADGRWRLALTDGTQLDAEHVWSTAPLTTLARRMHPPPPDAVREAAATLQHRAMVLLYLVLDQTRWTEYDAHYFPGPDVCASRLSEPRNYRDDPDDPPGRTVLCAELPCWPGDDVYAADDGVLAARLCAQLRAAGLPEPRPVEVTSRRLPHVYPVYRPGFADELAALERWAARTGLVTFGRQGLFTPDNTHHALAMGWAAADALRRDGSFDRDAWQTARDGFRSFVVED
jgi:protoporphyrinogen oxidase